MNSEVALTISDDSWLELCNIAEGTFSPLKGFMTKREHDSVVTDLHLPTGEPWTIPITLDLPPDYEKDLAPSTTVQLLNSAQQLVGKLEVSDVFRVDVDRCIKSIFGTSDPAHPGVALEARRSPFRVAGPVELIEYQSVLFPELALSPRQTKEIFAAKGWKTVVGFQTRNPLHRAHEYLHRVAMEVCDGIFLQPLIGWKKQDDFTPAAVVEAYQEQLRCFYPSQRALLGVLRTPMRYAGPREAVFHAIIRRNYGCTHFIVGRDHAGVGNFYGKYQAQELCAEFSDLGIEILPLKGPYYCSKCLTIVTEKTCGHGTEFEESVSGTKMRAMLSADQRPPENFMRREISDVLLKLAKEDRLFIGGA